MKRFAVWLCVLAIVLLGACGPSGGDAARGDPRDRLADVQMLELPIQASAAGEEPDLTRNVYFIFDGSGSMGDPLSVDCGGDQAFASKLEGAQWAVRTFVEKIPDDMNVGLYVFDRVAEREVVPLGRDNRREFLGQIDAVGSGGGTPLAQAIRFATDRLIQQYQKQLGYGTYRLVVVTDGIADDIPRAAIYAMQHRIPIYAIGLCVEADHVLRQYAVSYRSASTFSDLARGLEETVAELPTYDLQEFEQTVEEE